MKFKRENWLSDCPYPTNTFYAIDVSAYDDNDEVVPGIAVFDPYYQGWWVSPCVSLDEFPDEDAFLDWWFDTDHIAYDDIENDVTVTSLCEIMRFLME